MDNGPSIYMNINHFNLKRKKQNTKVPKNKKKEHDR